MQPGLEHFQSIHRFSVQPVPVSHQHCKKFLLYFKLLWNFFLMALPNSVFPLKLQTMLSLPCSLSPLPIPSCGEEHWWHRRGRSWVEIRTIYWKQQHKKMTVTPAKLMRDSTRRKKHYCSPNDWERPTIHNIWPQPCHSEQSLQLRTSFTQTSLPVALPWQEWTCAL